MQHTPFPCPSSPLPLLKRQLAGLVRDSITHLSWYRMYKSTEFEELCRFYALGMLSEAAFIEHASRLERLFTRK